jgi:hypothetical protein
VNRDLEREIRTRRRLALAEALVIDQDKLDRLGGDRFMRKSTTSTSASRPTR